MSDVQKLLADMASALDGAATWIDNMQYGSHARKLAAVDVVEYMPNGVAGRNAMREMAQKARLLAGADSVEPLTDDARLALGMVYHAMHNEWGMAEGRTAESPLLEWDQVKLLAQSGEDDATILLRLRRPDKRDAFLRVTVLDDTV